MTYWLAVRQGDEYRCFEDDLSALCRHTDALDARCATLGIPPLSSLTDTTDVQFNYAESAEELAALGIKVDKDGEPLLNPVTGLAYPLGVMQWHDVRTGQQVLEALAADPQTQGLSGIADELTWVLQRLVAQPDGTTFHLALIE